MWEARKNPDATRSEPRAEHRVNDGLNIVTHPILVMYIRIVAAVSFDRNLLEMGPSGILNLKV